MWEEAILASSRYCPGRTEEKHEKYQDSEVLAAIRPEDSARLHCSVASVTPTL
jgi:hypothetical protein